MKMIFRLLLLVSLLCGGLSVSAQQPVLNYTLAINPADTSYVQITMRVRNLPQVFHLAMVNHFLVDDGYWRFIEDLQISPGTVVREQDGLWRVTGAGNDATVRYKVRANEKGAFRVVRKPCVGDQVKLEVMRAGKLRQIMIDVASYDWPDVKLAQNPAANQRQQMMLASWQAGR
ncbi:MAG: hypothetical protein IPJ07_04320 [Acidobacteria bacterium]|nr:hypothetical protein [Acidobacteriota bacterium]